MSKQKKGAPVGFDWKDPAVVKYAFTDVTYNGGTGMACGVIVGGAIVTLDKDYTEIEVDTKTTAKSSEEIINAIEGKIDAKVNENATK